MHSVTKDILNSLRSNGNWLSYRVGDIPIVISAPHGGNIQPLNMPNRKYGVTVRDTYTRRLTELLADSFYTGRPYVLMADIHRKKVDLNRDISEGAQGVLRAQTMWRTWNSLLQIFIEDAKSRFGKVLYIEIHSQNDNDLIQLGYHLGAKDYLDLKHGDGSNAPSTMDALSKGNRKELLFGFESIEARLERLDYKIMLPTSNEGYFNGGRGIEVFSAFTSGVGAIQLEFPKSLLKSKLSKVSLDLSYTLLCFKRVYLNESI
jgi:hypothetical protein